MIKVNLSDSPTNFEDQLIIPIKVLEKALLIKDINLSRAKQAINKAKIL